ncbi:hypothetical protein ACJX0J_013607, partial [Zea mays]
HMYIDVAGWEVRIEYPSNFLADLYFVKWSVNGIICFVCICVADLCTCLILPFLFHQQVIDRQEANCLLHICALATRNYVIFLAIIPSSLEHFKRKKERRKNNTSFDANWELAPFVTCDRGMKEFAFPSTSKNLK